MTQGKSVTVYEVFRIMDGVALFLEEHYERLEKSMASIGKEAPLTLDELRERIEDLIEAQMDQGQGNDAAMDPRNHNMRLEVVTESEEGAATAVNLTFAPTSYPSVEMYREGVSTDLLEARRNNPHAKIVNQELRESANAMMREKDLFEVLLVNERGEITEGSRSNVFFIKGEKVYTCPAEGVLLGVTRQRILRLCEEAGIEVVEAPIEVDALSDYAAAFISGTSPKVLPIARIGGVRLDVDDPTLRTIMRLYDAAIKDYIARV